MQMNVDPSDTRHGPNYEEAVRLVKYAYRFVAHRSSSTPSRKALVAFLATKGYHFPVKFVSDTLAVYGLTVR